MSSPQPHADAEDQSLAGEVEAQGAEMPPDLLGPLLRDAPATLGLRLPAAGVLVGELVGLRSESPSALVVFPGIESATATTARSVIDLHGAHIGKAVVLMFDNGDITRPIVMGVLQDSSSWPAARRPGQVEVDADGERMVVGAGRQLVLRCGAASITLESNGKVAIRGTHVVSEAEGTNCIRGGSVQLN